MKVNLGNGSSRRVPNTREPQDYRESIIEDVIGEAATPLGQSIGVKRKARHRHPLMDRRWR